MPIYWDIGTELIAAHRYQEAVAHLSKAHELFPNQPIIEYMRAEALNRVGDRDAERKVVDSLRTNMPGLAGDPFFHAVFGLEGLRQGRREEAVRALDRMELMRRTQYVEPMLAVELCSELGDRAKLLEWLRRADRERSTLFVYLPMLSEFYRLDPGVVAELTR